MKIKVKNETELSNENEIRKTFGLNKTDMYLVKFILSLIQDGKIKRQKYKFKIDDFWEINGTTPDKTECEEAFQSMNKLAKICPMYFWKDGRIDTVKIGSIISKPEIVDDGTISYLLNKSVVEDYNLIKTE